MRGDPVQSKSPREPARVVIQSETFFSFSYTKILLTLLILSLPLVNPWVHGDGVGYYAYAHSLLIHHDLQFEDDWRGGNATFAMDREEATGMIAPDQYTATHHLDNHFAVGPAILWAPFLIVVHLAILTLDHFGAHVVANGFSRPYLVTMALATAGYGFLGLLLSFHIARRYVAERWAFLATVGYWFASSLPVYMYLNPSWSHAHSLFVNALFLWYWQRTRGRRSGSQWCVLGLLGALMTNVYYLNVILLLVPALEALPGYFMALRKGRNNCSMSLSQMIGSHFLFVICFVAGLLPTLITKKIIYGGFFSTGYPGVSEWTWMHPLFWRVLFSSDHGLLSWTPILILAGVGILLFQRYDRNLAYYIWAIYAVFYYVICCYYNWDGLSSFGNRFFISLGPIFILGLAVLFDWAHSWWKSEQMAFISSSLILFLFVAWNVGFIFQWGDHLIPVRGPISWRVMTYNQFRVVPEKMWETGKAFLFARKHFLHEIERKDMQQLQKEPPSNLRP